MSATNGETLRSYETRIQEYIDGTSQEVSGAAKDWIEASLAGLLADAKILELGSAFGRDAAYVVSRGFGIECTDAVPGFVAHLRERGFCARQFNLLTDSLADRYDLILANAVLLHFAADEFAMVLKKLRAALKGGGRLAFSLKRGQGEEWSTGKLGAPRFFRYWQPEGVAPYLRDAGFAQWSIDEAQTARAHAEWLFVIASAP